MCREVNFGDNFNASCLCISYNLLDFFLSVVTFNGSMAHIKALPVMKLTTDSLAADFSKKGMLFDFNSPALVVCKMPVETVKLVKCHKINKLLYGFSTEEVTAFVKLHTSPGVKGLVADFAASHLVFAVNKLLECNHRIESTTVITSENLNSLFAYFKHVFFFLNLFGINEANVGFFSFFAHYT